MKLRTLSALALVIVLVTSFFFIPAAYPRYYRDYDTFMAAFKNFATQYPNLVTYETVGKTVENKDILMFKIGNPNGGRVLFDGTIHGTENLGGELLYCYANWLLTSNDPLAQNILARDYTLLIPILNIDGMIDYLRTNANGVDLNRNFATDWRYGNSDPTSDTYRGPSPLSEPESQTLIRVFQNYKPEFYVNLHMWAGPYYAGSAYANRTYYQTLVSKITSLSQQRGVTMYRYSGEFGGAGYAIGDAAVAGITSFLIELGRDTPPLSEIETQFLPEFIPIAAILSQECEKISFHQFGDGFEYGTFNSWSGITTTSGDTATIVNTVHYEGDYSAKFQTNSISSGTKRAFVQKTIDESAVVYARAYFLISAGLPLPDSGDRFTIIQFANTAGEIICSLQIRNVQGSDRFVLLSSTGAMQNTTALYPKQNTWQCLELYAKIDSTDGSIKVYIDGVERLSMTYLDTSLGNVASVRFGLVSSINVQKTVITYVDNVVISQTYIGPRKSPDINGDGDINIRDVSLIALAWLTISGDDRYDWRCDLNSDGKININDVSIFIIAFSGIED
jgi:hypothetical protein